MKHIDLRLRSGWIAGVLCCTLFALQAQTPADSTALVSAPWQTLEQGNGYTVKAAALPVFGSEQEIYMAEIDPHLYRLRFCQPENRTTVKRLGKESETAVLAINGGFFVTKTDQALANDFLKIDGNVMPIAGGWGSAAVALDSAGQPGFLNDIQGLAASDSLWHHPYPDIMAAGPMLLLSGVQLIPNNNGDTQRHPRTVIGIRPDGTIVLMVVDGRQKGADGMSPSELAYTAQTLGMTSALNLDGGGSSTLWSRRDQTVNRPSDKVLFIRIPRQVANAVLVEPIAQ